MASSVECLPLLPVKFGNLLATVALTCVPLQGQITPAPQLHNSFALTFQVLSDTGDADLRPFAQHMYQAIKEKAWDTLPKSVLYGEQGVVTVQVKIQKNGKLLFLPAVISSSGKKELDRHAVSVIRGAVPFDKLPAAAPAPIELRINFYYNVLPPSPGP